MPNEPPEPYSSEQVSRIIQRALQSEREADISQAELIETGKEMGLDETTIKAAIEAERRESNHRKILQRRKTGFYWHLYSYLMVNFGLFVINSLVPGPWWFQWSVLGWGIGIVFHGKAVFFSSGNP